jgi:hypothetical protein
MRFLRMIKKFVKLFNSFNIADKILCISPVFPLLEAILSEPIGTVDINVNETSVPYLHFILLFVPLFGVKKFYWSSLSTFLYTISVCSIFFGLFVYDKSNASKFIEITYTQILLERVGLFILLTFAFIYSSTSTQKSYSKLDVARLFVFVYTLLSLAIYIFRFIKYDGNLFRIRGGVNIYGGNPLIGVQLLYLTSIFFFKKKKQEDIYIFLLMVLVAILFMNRISIVLVVIGVILIYWKKILNLKFLVILPLIVAVSYNQLLLVIDSKLIQGIIFRFTAGNKGLSFDSATSTRQDIWETAIKLGIDYPFFGIGTGMHKYYATRTSAHSIFLNNHAELGLFMGGIVNVIILILLPVIFLKGRDKYLSSYFYLCFLVIGGIAGLKFLQASGYSSSFTFLIFFIFLNTLGITKLNYNKII